MIEKCIVCGGMKFGQVMKIKDHLVSRKTFTLVECKRCSFRFVKDVPPATEAGEYYETEEYVEHSDSAEGVVNRVYHVARSWMLRHKRNLVSNSTLPKTILDIGTGTGYFLNHMKLHGYQTYGLEISDRARTFGQDEFGLDIRRPQALYQDDFPEISLLLPSGMY
ncbi:MAG: methyltransferase domain-containing protein [Bacteroidota bacterium]